VADDACRPGGPAAGVDHRLAADGRRRGGLRLDERLHRPRRRATIGVISPTGNEVGPFLAIEQAALSQTIPDARRTPTFAWYNLAGYVATALGALTAGLISQALLGAGFVPADAYRAVVIGYALIGLLMALVFWRVDADVEAPTVAADDGIRRRLGLGRSRGIIARLSALFALDAFGGGFIPQSLMAYWFHLQFGVEPAVLGLIFFGANLLAAVSSLAAPRIAARIGLVRTMVFTHLPSNILLILVPLMPTLPLAVLVLFARFSLSQMDVPTRQSYVISVVDPDERSAAAGVTGIARTTGAAISPALAAPLVASAGLAAVPFYLAGGLKILYDLLLYRSFTSGRAPDERGAGRRELGPDETGRTPEPRGRRGQAAGGLGGGSDSVRRGRPGIPIRHQTNPMIRAATARAITRSNGWSAWRMSSQLAPRTVPA
jgi:MFS family permease